MSCCHDVAGSGRLVALLAVIPAYDDYVALERQLKGGALSGPADVEWLLVRYATARPAIGELQHRRFPMLICDTDGETHEWRDLLEHLQQLSDPPLLIVQSRRVDERLWSEALHAGAWDVLAKPASREELGQVLASAWLHWLHRPRSTSADVPGRARGNTRPAGGRPAALEKKVQTGMTVPLGGQSQ